MNADNIYFTSDTHFYHKNVIAYENRVHQLGIQGWPYKSVETMNSEIIKIWNNTVNEEDIVYHLGDFCFGSTDDWIEVLEQLNGHIHLIKGNHDKTSKIAFDKFESVTDIKEIKLTFSTEKIPVTLCHYPMLTWNRSHYGAWQLFGHVHKIYKFNPHAQRSINVGWDIWKSPISANQLANIFYKQYCSGVE